MKLRSKKQTLSSDDPLMALMYVKGKRKRNDTPLMEQLAQAEALPTGVSSDDLPMASKSVTEKVMGKRNENKAQLKEQAQCVKNDEKLVGRRIKVWWPLDRSYYIGVVKSFDCITKRHKVLYADGDEEFLDLKTERWRLLIDMFTENVSPKSDCLAQTQAQAPPRRVSFDNPLMASQSVTEVKGKLEKNNAPLKEQVVSPLPTEVSSLQSGLVCVQGYMVKNSVAPILEDIFKKHGDITSECLVQKASAREHFLDSVCEVVRQIQSNDVNLNMQEIETTLSDAEAVQLNVSWLRAHLEAIHERKQIMKKSTLLMETKQNTNLVKRTAEMNLKKRRIEFEKAERCVKVLQLIEEKLNNNFLEFKAKEDLLVKLVI